jgi:stage V sporulation protein B
MKVTDERIALIPAIIVAVPVYFLLLIAFKCIDEKVLRMLPGGKKTVKILKKVHMI